jgi:MoaA/NifB/PqqE/SkfB family radical SAM enzyme
MAAGSAETEVNVLRDDRAGRGLSFDQWLRFGPWLAQLVVVRRCNLSCRYCTEYDKTSEPVPFGQLKARLERLSALRTWAVCLTGGEPTLHPQLVDLVREMRRLGFRRRQLITNGFLLTKDLIEALNAAELTDLQISVDGVVPNDTTVKTLERLRKKLMLLAEQARFRVVVSGVIGSAPPQETLQVIEFARTRGFQARILLLHDSNGQIRLSTEELSVYREVAWRLGREAREANDYRGRLIATGEAPFKCRSGSRYLYVDEFGRVSWCAQTRTVFSRELAEYGLEDLKTQFHTVKECSSRCTVGCARTASAVDQWRSQGSYFRNLPRASSAAPPPGIPPKGSRLGQAGATGRGI